VCGLNLADGAAAEKAKQLIEAWLQIAELAPSQQQHPPHDGTCQDTTHSEECDHPCPHCGSRMVIIETFEPGHRPRHRPSAPMIIIPINTS